MRYLISYDLRKPDRDYQKLWDALDAMKAEPVLDSQWIAKRTKTSVEKLRDHFKKVIDSNDRLLVVCLDSDDWAGFNLKRKISTF